MDETIKTQILAAFKEEPKLDEEHIIVEVDKGEVLLKGKADTEAEKRMAEDIALKTPGVVKVINHLHLPAGLAHALTVLATQITEPPPEEEKHDKKDPE